ncbi:hypothetical protein F5Y13DRAFT_189757 [Hypoxylon sp. FL1857]|nr:hypothetical protein F5Y13DRAFT_189757 [Hypoxylon sp. FL1857]
MQKNYTLEDILDMCEKLDQAAQRILKCAETIQGLQDGQLEELRRVQASYFASSVKFWRIFNFFLGVISYALVDWAVCRYTNVGTEERALITLFAVVSGLLVVKSYQQF